MKAGYWDFVGQRGSQITQAGQITIGFGSMIENLTTGSGHDTVFGNELGNKVVLGAGNDRATGGAGNDAIDGGAGLDTSVFTGVRSNYTVTLGAGQTTLKDNIGTDGTDTCGFRRCRPGIPIEAGHLFRSKSATHSGDVGHPSGLVLSCRRG